MNVWTRVKLGIRKVRRQARAEEKLEAGKAGQKKSNKSSATSSTVNSQYLPTFAFELATGEEDWASNADKTTPEADRKTPDKPSTQADSDSAFATAAEVLSFKLPSVRESTPGCQSRVSLMDTVLQSRLQDSTVTESRTWANPDSTSARNRTVHRQQSDQGDRAQSVKNLFCDSNEAGFDGSSLASLSFVVRSATCEEDNEPGSSQWAGRNNRSRRRASPGTQMEPDDENGMAQAYTEDAAHPRREARSQIREPDPQRAPSEALIQPDGSDTGAESGTVQAMSSVAATQDDLTKYLQDRSLPTLSLSDHGQRIRSSIKDMTLADHVVANETTTAFRLVSELAAQFRTSEWVDRSRFADPPGHDTVDESYENEIAATIEDRLGYESAQIMTLRPMKYSIRAGSTGICVEELDSASPLRQYQHSGQSQYPRSNGCVGNPRRLYSCRELRPRASATLGNTPVWSLFDTESQHGIARSQSHINSIFRTSPTPSPLSPIRRRGSIVNQLEDIREDQIVPVLRGNSLPHLSAGRGYTPAFGSNYESPWNVPSTYADRPPALDRGYSSNSRHRHSLDRGSAQVVHQQIPDDHHRSRQGLPFLGCVPIRNSHTSMQTSSSGRSGIEVPVSKSGQRIAWQEYNSRA